MNPQSNNSELLISTQHEKNDKGFSYFSLHIIRVSENCAKYLCIHHEPSEEYQSNILVKSGCLSFLGNFFPFSTRHEIFTNKCRGKWYLVKSVEILTQKLIGLKRFFFVFSLAKAITKNCWCERGKIDFTGVNRITTERFLTLKLFFLPFMLFEMSLKRKKGSGSADNTRWRKTNTAKTVWTKLNFDRFKELFFVILIEKWHETNNENVLEKQAMQRKVCYMNIRKSVLKTIRRFGCEGKKIKIWQVFSCWDFVKRKKAEKRWKMGENYILRISGVSQFAGNVKTLIFKSFSSFIITSFLLLVFFVLLCCRKIRKMRVLLKFQEFHSN